MRIKSFSKINLSLRVLNKLKSGMHNIETNSVIINLFDEIMIKKNDKDKVFFTGKFKNKVNSKKNTIIDTLNLLKKKNMIKNSYKIIVKKNIPVFAGLGGGTSNSFFLTKRLLKKKLDKKLIYELEKKIGSDLKLFLNNSSFQKNLNTVYKTKQNIYKNIIVVFPKINCKTKNIYRLVKSYSSPTGKRYLNTNVNQFNKMITQDRNDLQKVVEKKYPEITKLLQNILEQKGCTISRMTGSGSACFGLFKSKKTAKLALGKLKRKYPKYWCVITKTI